jgi:hypothetical protein
MYNDSRARDCHRQRDTHCSRGRRRRPSAIHREVDARLIGLLSFWRIPVPLNDAIARCRTFATEIGRHRDLEVGVIRRNGMRIRCIVGEIDQFASENGVCLGIDDCDVGLSSVGCTNFDSHVEDLPWSEFLDVGSVVGKLIAFA